MTDSPEAPDREPTGAFARLRAILARRIVRRIRDYLLTGVLVTAPIGITIYLTWFFITVVDTTVSFLIPERYHPPMAIPGLGLVLSITFFILVGWFARNFMGRLLIRISEFVVHKLPVIRTLYSAIKQIVETILASQSQAFREVVLVEYPRKGVWSIGFITGITQGEIQRVTSEETFNVFVPTTPNPTSGYLLFLPKSQIFHLDMTVEEGIKLVVSAGIITPPDRGDPKETNLLGASPKKGIFS